jgi:hypothetical protein
MKSTIITITFILLSFISNAQRKYFYPNLYSSYLLDSLSIPYIPMELRVSGEEYSKNFEKKFIEFFGDDLSFNPNESSDYLAYELFTFNKEFVSERDSFFNFFMSDFECYVVGQSCIPMKNYKFKSIWIVELHSTLNDTYCVVLFHEHMDGRFEPIYEKASLVSDEYFDKQKYQ